jgi:oligoribonuclease NrnB/cAMP/cGMP phosphodiesterase (DHH superfamily)
LGEIVKKIEQDKFLHGDKNKFLILITDLNLTTKEANWIEKEAIRVDAKLQLLDHHATGVQASERFAWYKLDTTKSATLITYNWLREHHDFDKEGSLSDIVKTINAIDIWLSDDEYFEFGKVCLGMIAGAKEINRILFPNEDRSLKLTLIEEASAFVSRDDGNILLDDALHSIKKRFFISDKNDTKDNLVASYISRLLTIDRARLTINYRGYRGILGYNVGSSSLIGNRFLLDNPDYDFYMDVNYRGNFSLRSNDKLDVSKMAMEIGNGGGHPNASGGKIENFKDSFVYSTLKSFIQEYIETKTF